MILARLPRLTELTELTKNIANSVNLNKIVVQTKKTANPIPELCRWF